MKNNYLSNYKNRNITSRKVNLKLTILYPGENTGAYLVLYKPLPLLNNTAFYN